MRRARRIRVLASLGGAIAVTVLLVAGLSEPASAGTDRLYSSEARACTDQLDRGWVGLSDFALGDANAGSTDESLPQALEPAAIQLEIFKTDTLTEVAPGQTVTYTIAMTNSDSLTATGVVVTDTLPVSMTYQSGTPSWTQVGSTRDYTVAVGTLPAGYTETLSLTLTLADPVPAGLEFITNTVRVADDAGAYAEDSDVDAVDADPDLFISKTDYASSTTVGAPIVYTVFWGNQGTQGAAGVVITETVPTNTTFDLGASDPGWAQVGTSDQYRLTVGPVPAGATGSAAFAVTVDGSLPAGVTAIVNEAQIADDGTSGPDFNPGNDSDNDLDTVAAQPDLTIAKTNLVDTVDTDEVFTYTLTVSNTGTQGATGVVVSDTLPAHTTFLTASHGASYSDPVVTWPAFSLSAGASATRTVCVQVAATIPAAVETITNTASAADDGANGDDLDPLNNGTEDVDSVTAAPDLVLAKTDGQTLAPTGQILTYTVSVTNAGTQGATNVVLSDTIPTHTTFLTASHGASFSDPVVTWPPFNLGASASATRTVWVQVAATIPEGVETITNTASAADDGSNGDDLDPLNNGGEDVDTLMAGPDLVLAKTDGRVEVHCGEILTYTLTVTNTGTVTATGVVVCDRVPTHTTFLTASHGAIFSDPVATWPLFDLGAGASATRTVTVQVAATISPSVKAITNTALVCDDGDHGLDPDPGNNTAVDITHIQPYRLYLPLVFKEQVAVGQAVVGAVRRWPGAQLYSLARGRHP